MKRLTLYVGAAAALLLPARALAHCPLCTAGAGAAALGAAWLGVGSGAIGVWIGAFALALGLWLSRVIKRRFVPHQTLAISLLSFATTVFPIKPLFAEYGSVYVSLAGDYGTLLNRTYPINLFVAGAVVGGLLLAAAPFVSRALLRRLGKIMPYQGIVITFALLLAASLVSEFAL